MINLDERLELATSTVKEAAKLVLGMWANSLTEELKVDNSPVTKADRASEDFIRAIILKAFPEDGFLGEESGRIIGTSDLFWSCDPIDGTWSYLNHEHTCTICLSLHAKDESVLLTVIYNPFTKTMYRGTKDKIPSRNDQTLPLVKKVHLDDSVVNFFISPGFYSNVEKLFLLRKQQVIGKLVSHGGSIAHSLAEVAAGINTVFVGLSYRSSKIWDLAGGIFLIRQAGGCVTDLNGVDLDSVLANQVLVASINPKIHARMLAELKRLEF